MLKNKHHFNSKKSVYKYNLKFITAKLSRCAHILKQVALPPTSNIFHTFNTIIKKR